MSTHPQVAVVRTGAITGHAVALFPLGTTLYLSDLDEVWLATNDGATPQWTFIGKGGATGALTRYVAGSRSTANEDGEIAGQFVFTPDEVIVGLRLALRVVMNASGAATITLRLKNLTADVYVALGPGSTDHLAVASPDPTVVLSEDLFTAPGFMTPATTTIFQVEIQTSSSEDVVYLGIAELVYSSL